MKIYLFAKETGQAIQKTIHQEILTFFKQNGLVVLSNLISATAAEEQLSFEKMNGLVVEGEKSATEAGYLIAMALAQNKPILYLMPKGALLPDQLKLLQENSKLKKLFLLHYYSERSLTKFLVDFIDIIETGELRREVPTVKFTLRFTPRADRYLNWLNRNKKYKKADYLRKLIDEKIQADEEYQAQLRQSGDQDELVSK